MRLGNPGIGTVDAGPAVEARTGAAVAAGGGGSGAGEGGSDSGTTAAAQVTAAVWAKPGLGYWGKAELG